RTQPKGKQGPKSDLPPWFQGNDFDARTRLSSKILPSSLHTTQTSRDAPFAISTQTGPSPTKESNTTIRLDEASAISHPKPNQLQAPVSPEPKSTPRQAMRDYTLAITDLKELPWLTDLMECSTVQEKLDYVDPGYRNGCQSALQDFAANCTSKGVEGARLEELILRNGVPVADPSVQYVHRIIWNCKLLETMTLVSQRPADRQGILSSRGVSRTKFDSSMILTNGMSDLAEWPDLVRTLRGCVSGASKERQPEQLPQGDDGPCHRLELLLWQTSAYYQLQSQSHLSKVLENLAAVVLHISIFKSIEAAPWRAKPSSRLRGPLYAALAVSPLVLLSECFISSSDVKRAALVHHWLHLGNRHPPIVTEIEFMLWECIKRAVDGEMKIFDSFLRFTTEAGERLDSVGLLSLDDSQFFALDYGEPLDHGKTIHSFKALLKIGAPTTSASIRQVHDSGSGDGEETETQNTTSSRVGASSESAKNDGDIGAGIMSKDQVAFHATDGTPNGRVDANIEEANRSDQRPNPGKEFKIQGCSFSDSSLPPGVSEQIHNKVEDKMEQTGKEKEVYSGSRGFERNKKTVDNKNQPVDGTKQVSAAVVRVWIDVNNIHIENDGSDLTELGSTDDGDTSEDSDDSVEDAIVSAAGLEGTSARSRAKRRQMKQSGGAKREKAGGTTRKKQAEGTKRKKQAGGTKRKKQAGGTKREKQAGGTNRKKQAEEVEGKTKNEMSTEVEIKQQEQSNLLVRLTTSRRRCVGERMRLMDYEGGDSLIYQPECYDSEELRTLLTLMNSANSTNLDYLDTSVFAVPLTQDIDHSLTRPKPHPAIRVIHNDDLKNYSRRDLQSVFRQANILIKGRIIPERDQKWTASNLSSIGDLNELRDVHGK
ncbi:hypothetical protein V5O48_014963, partial [Marasmius crinis-equi]